MYKNISKIKKFEQTILNVQKVKYENLKIWTSYFECPKSKSQTTDITKILYEDISDQNTWLNRAIPLL